MTTTYYKSFNTDLGSGNIDYDADIIKVALVTSMYTFVKTHNFFDDINNEVVAAGYTAGGNTLTGKTAVQNDTTNKTLFSAADTTFTATITARAMILYKSTGTALTSPLMGFLDFGSDQSDSGGTFLVQFTNGIFELGGAAA